MRGKERRKEGEKRGGSETKGKEVGGKRGGTEKEGEEEGRREE